MLIHVRAGRAKLKIREVPSMEHERIFGESKLNAMRDGVRILRMILRERMAIRARVKVQSDAVQLPFVELKSSGIELDAVTADG